MAGYRSGLRGLLIGSVVLGLAACATNQGGGGGVTKPAAVVALAPAAAQPDPANLKPGLAVGYSRITADHINDVIASGAGRQGEPVLVLDQKEGSSDVLTSGKRTDIAATLTGFIQFPEAGAYAFKVFSNDGVRVSIDNQVILDDPTVHGGRFSNEQSLSVAAPGYYPVKVLYFQKRGGSALQLYWRTPGGGDFTTVPASAYAH